MCRVFLGSIGSVGFISREKELPEEFELCWPKERGAWGGKDIVTEIVDGDGGNPGGFGLW